MTVRNLDSLLRDVGVAGKCVFVRADLNVPIQNGEVGDPTRIIASLPTLKKLVAAKARVILSSHLGRPKGVRVPELSLRPVSRELAARLGTPVSFVEDCTGDEVDRAVEKLSDGEILLLENLRFHPGETKNDPGLSRDLAKWAQCYVNDAFGTAHRAHASTAGMVSLVENVAAGDLMQAELANLDLLFKPERPFLCLIGGAKVSDKMGVLEALIERADTVAIGGAMAYTFLLAQGKPVGTSLVEPDRVDDAKRIIEAAESSGCSLLLPTDHVVARKPGEGSESRLVAEIPEGWMALDIGSETAATYAAAAWSAATILWNGPMGMFEVEACAAGTAAVAEAVASSDATSVVGGGDSLAAVNQLGVGDRIDHLSTGGGASLEYVQGIELPGVASLER